jgi:hypothetical protein
MLLPPASAGLLAVSAKVGDAAPTAAIIARAAIVDFLIMAFLLTSATNKRHCLFLLLLRK